jgi:cob(I)alamin adenosyltransferase
MTQNSGVTKLAESTKKLEKRDLSSGSPGPGLVQIFTGDGKGKTSAAMGAIIRALGHGRRVYVTFFMKGDYPYGERLILGQLPHVTVSSFGQEEFVDPARIKLEQIAQAGQALTAAREAVLSGKYDMVVLDEVNLAAAWKLVAVEDVMKLIKDKPRNVDIILTGRLADARLIRIADLVTEMVKVKHPYDKGVPARQGIEY